MGRAEERTKRQTNIQGLRLTKSSKTSKQEVVTRYWKYLYSNGCSAARLPELYLLPIDESSRLSLATKNEASFEAPPPKLPFIQFSR